MVMFGGPSLASKVRWKHLQRSMGRSELVNWARLSSIRDPVTALPCSEAEFSALTKRLQETGMMTPKDELILQEGVKFHDGSTLRRLNGSWWLNDRELTSLSLSLPLTLLANQERREGWDVSSMLLALASCSPALHDVFRAERPHGLRLQQGEGRVSSAFRPLAGMLVWLSNRIQLDRVLHDGEHPSLAAMAWAYDLHERALLEANHAYERLFSDALHHRPPGVFEAYDVPWMKAWREVDARAPDHQTVKWALDLSKQHLGFRVRTQLGNLRRIRVPPEPEVWALLISLCLSPHSSYAGKLLLGMQHNWSIPYTKGSKPSDAMVRSLEFCHDIMNGLGDRLYVQDDTVLVFGKLGHAYQIRVGIGQHGAPYQIQHIEATDNLSRHAICIHSGLHSNRLPLGDILGAVFLALADDINTRLKVDSLNEVIIGNPPFGFPDTNIPDAWLATLDQDALTSLKRDGHVAAGHAWFAPPEIRRYNNGDVEPRFNQIVRRYMHHRSRRHFGAASEMWVECFAAGLASDGVLPMTRVVEAWRRTVEPRQARKASRPEGVRHFHRWLRRQRYHDILGHRRQDDPHEQGDIRDGERRWCEVFARCWQAMGLQPIGSFIDLPIADGGQMNFQHVGLTLTVRNRIERRFLGSIARLLGYVEENEHAQRRRYIRRDHPRAVAQLELTNLLRIAQEQQNIRGAPPRWWHYAQPMAAPDRLSDNIPWELHVDLTDEPLRLPREGFGALPGFMELDE